MILIGPLVACLIMAALAPFLVRRARRWAGAALALPAAAQCVAFATQIGPVSEGRFPTARVAWIADLGWQLDLRLDGLALLFALLVTGIGSLVLLYAGRYSLADPRLDRLLSILCLFMGAMLGVVLSDGLIAFYAFWELTSITSFLLISHKHAREEAREAARQGLLVTVAGGLAMLAGIATLSAAGFSTFSSLGDLRSHPQATLVLALMAAGAFTKSALVPFHFWLPNAMEAPTPVSAYLHSATMVQAGIFLMARLAPSLSGTEIWFWSLAGAGAATVVVSSLLAVVQTDLKRMLAYTTVGALGTLALLLGMPGPYAAQAFAAYLLAHALYKGALFMIAGAIDHEVGTRDIRQLGGLAFSMRSTLGATILSSLAAAGMIGWLSFAAKEYAKKATLGAELGTPLWLGALLVGSAASVAVAVLLVVRPFFGPRIAHGHDGPAGLWLGPWILGLVGLAAGVGLDYLGPFLLAPVARSVRPNAEGYSFAMVEGLSATLLFSAGAVVLGLGLGLTAHRWREGLTRGLGALRLSSENAYRALYKGTLALAAWQTRLLQHGRLRLYVTATLLVVVAAAWTPFLRSGSLTIPGPGQTPRVHEIVVVAAALISIVIACLTTRRLTAIVALGIVGYGVALVYVFFGAPDLALTQLFVETLTLVLFMFIFLHLPRLSRRSSRDARLRDAIIAGVAGTSVALFSLVVTSRPPRDPAATFFATASVPQAFGYNVVNTILVDFRALDTLGEVLVIALAAVGVFALLKGRPEREAQR